MVPDRRHGGHWGVVAALIGYIALAVYAVVAQPESGTPIAEGRQAVHGKPNGGADNDQTPSYPVTTLKALRAAEDAGAADCGTSEACSTKQREYSDLQAQWHAAEGAQGQLYFARWQTLLAVVGTALLVWTLYETRIANGIARDAYLTDQRPWVAVEVQPAGAPDWSMNGCNVPLAFFLENTGKTPALGVEVNARIDIAFGRFTYFEDHAALMRRQRRAPVADASALFPGKNTVRFIIYSIPISRIEESRRMWAERERASYDFIKLFIYGCVSYASKAGRTLHHSPFILHLNTVSDDRRFGRGISPGLPEASLKNLILIDEGEGGQPD